MTKDTVYVGGIWFALGFSSSFAHSIVAGMTGADIARATFSAVHVGLMGVVVHVVNAMSNIKTDASHDLAVSSLQQQLSQLRASPGGMTGTVGGPKPAGQAVVSVAPTAVATQHVAVSTAKPAPTAGLS